MTSTDVQYWSRKHHLTPLPAPAWGISERLRRRRPAAGTSRHQSLFRCIADRPNSRMWATFLPPLLSKGAISSATRMWVTPDLSREWWKHSATSTSSLRVISPVARIDRFPTPHSTVAFQFQGGAREIRLKNAIIAGRTEQAIFKSHRNRTKVSRTVPLKHSPQSAHWLKTAGCGGNHRRSLSGRAFCANTTQAQDGATKPMASVGVSIS